MLDFAIDLSDVINPNTKPSLKSLFEKHFGTESLSKGEIKLNTILKLYTLTLLIYPGFDLNIIAYMKKPTVENWENKYITVTDPKKFFSVLVKLGDIVNGPFNENKHPGDGTIKSCYLEPDKEFFMLDKEVVAGKNTIDLAFAKNKLQVSNIPIDEEDNLDSFKPFQPKSSSEILELNKKALSMMTAASPSTLCLFVNKSPVPISGDHDDEAKDQFMTYRNYRSIRPPAQLDPTDEFFLSRVLTRCETLNVFSNAEDSCRNDVEMTKQLFEDQVLYHVTIKPNFAIYRSIMS
jgi:hypothetical protein